MSNEKKKLSKLSPEQIIGYCQENFVNIVPNMCSGKVDRSRARPVESHHEK